MAFPASTDTDTPEAVAEATAEPTPQPQIDREQVEEMHLARIEQRGLDALAQRAQAALDRRRARQAAQGPEGETAGPVARGAHQAGADGEETQDQQPTNILAESIKTEAKAKQDIAGVVGDVAEDVVKSPLDVPTQAIAGTVDAINESLDLMDELQSAAGVPDAIRKGPFEQLTGIKPRLPKLPGSRTKTGEFVRSGAQFVTGWVGAGKFLKALKPLTKSGALLKAAGQGAIADFTVFDPHEERLSNLIQEFPALENPVNEFLAADGDDPALIGRLKNAVEGAAIGVPFDTFLAALKAHRAVRKVRAQSELIDESVRLAGDVAPFVKTADPAEIRRLLGEPAPKSPNLADGGDLSPEDALRSADDLDDGIFINWNRIEAADDVKALIRQTVNADEAAINEGRRGRVSFEEMELTAAQTDAWEVMTRERKDGFPSAEEQLAVRNLWVTSGNKLKELATLAAQNPSDTNVFAFRRMMAVHNTVQREALAIRTETARALAQWRIPAGESAEFSQNLDTLLKQNGGLEVGQSLAEKISKLAASGNELELEKLARVGPWAKTQRMVAQFWYFSLLSGPHTHMRNMLSNTGIMAQSLYERKAAELISKFTGSEAVAAGEALEMWNADVSLIKDAFIYMGKSARILPKTTVGGDEFGDFAGKVAESFRTGESGHGIGKVDSAPDSGMSAEFWELDPESAAGRVMDFMDTLTSIPGRALAAGDEIAKTATYRRELAAQAQRKARREVEAGELDIADFDDRKAEIIADPDETIRMTARAEAQYRTLTQDAAAIPANVVKSWQKIPVVGRLTMPFRNTPINAFTYGLERTPFAPLVGQWKADFAAGGARKDMALAKMLTGTATLAMMSDFALRGVITGDGPSNRGQRANMRRQGIQPRSVGVNFSGDPENPDIRYFSYRGLEPISAPLGLASNLVEILQFTDWEDDDIDIQQAIIAVNLAIAHQATSATFMTGMSDFLDAMSDPRRSGEHFFQRIAGAAVPTGVAQITRFNDPYMRAAADMLDAIRARTPGLSEDLPIRHDMWGRDFDRRSGLGGFYDAVSPLYSRKYNPEPIDLEMEKLGLWMGKPGITMTLPVEDEFGGEVGISINMKEHPEWYERFVELQGNELTEDVNGVPIDVMTGMGLMDTLNALVTGEHPLSTLYSNAGGAGADSERSTMIRAKINEYRRAAKRALIEEFPELKAELESRRKKLEAF